MPMYGGSFRAHRKDKNHKDIVDELRDNGYIVLELYELGMGRPDFLVYKNASTYNAYLVEVKVADKHGNPKPLTASEKKFHASWKGPPILIVTCTQDIITLIER